MTNGFGYQLPHRTLEVDPDTGEREDPEEVAERTLRACVEGKVKTVEGQDISIQFESICFHSDTPGSLAIGTAVRRRLLEAGIAIRGPGELAAAA